MLQEARIVRHGDPESNAWPTTLLGEVVEEEKVVEEDVRKEEVDIDDQTEHRNG